MTEVRKHQRTTATGKRTTVRHHTRGGERTRREDEAEEAREAWADRAAPHVSTLGGETDPQPEEWWDGESEEPEGDWWDAYPCAMCSGTGRSRFSGMDSCDRCSGSGNDPYAMR